MAPTPLWPARTFSQTWSVPMPRAQTNPTPVTTTRRLNVEISPGGIQRGLFLGLSVFIDIGDGILDGGDFLGVLVRNLDAKTLFNSHDELDGLEGARGCAPMAHEPYCRCYVLLRGTLPILFTGNS